MCIRDSRHVTIPVRGDRYAVVYRRISKPPAPLVRAARIELHDEAIVFLDRKRLKRPSSEVDTLPKGSSDEYIPRRIRRDALSLVQRIEIRKPLAPLMNAGRVILGDDDIGAAERLKIAAAHVNAPGGEAGNNDVAHRVDRDAVSPIISESAETLAPLMHAGRVVLGDEDIGLAHTDQRSPAQIGRAEEMAAYENVAGCVDSNVVDVITLRSTAGFAPHVHGSGSGKRLVGRIDKNEQSADKCRFHGTPRSCAACNAENRWDAPIVSQQATLLNGVGADRKT